MYSTVIIHYRTVTRHLTWDRNIWPHLVVLYWPMIKLDIFNWRYLQTSGDCTCRHARSSMMHLWVQPHYQTLLSFKARRATTLMRAISMLLATHCWLINDYKVKNIWQWIFDSLAIAIWLIIMQRPGRSCQTPDRQTFSACWPRILHSSNEQPVLMILVSSHLSCGPQRRKNCIHNIPLAHE